MSNYMSKLLLGIPTSIKKTLLMIMLYCMLFGEAEQAIQRKDHILRPTLKLQGRIEPYLWTSIGSLSKARTRSHALINWIKSIALSKLLC